MTTAWHQTLNKQREAKFCSAYLVLGLGFGWLKRACQDCELDILQLLWHLWVAHVFIYDNAVHQLGVL